MSGDFGIYNTDSERRGFACLYSVKSLRHFQISIVTEVFSFCAYDFRLHTHIPASIHRRGHLSITQLTDAKVVSQLQEWHLPWRRHTHFNPLNSLQCCTLVVIFSFFNLSSLLVFVTLFSPDSILIS